MGVIIYSFNLNISPKMSHGVLECDIAVTELHAYDFAVKDFVIKKGQYLCHTLYILCLPCAQHWSLYLAPTTITPYKGCSPSEAYSPTEREREDRQQICVPCMLIG